MVELERIESDKEAEEVRGLIEKHQQYTGSPVAAEALGSWNKFLRDCIRVIPTDYKRVLLEQTDGEVASV